ncbi:MAG TPA: hypothetical protein VFT95_10255 [Micromonosporaceae bacterium]|nr:hypothetical protein [Micromonosporaceae bacterium]
MPADYYLDFELTERRIDVSVDGLVSDLEMRLERIGAEPEPGGESIVITKGCTRTCFRCSDDGMGGTCTCGCLPGVGLEGLDGLDVRGW